MKSIKLFLYLLVIAYCCYNYYFYNYDDFVPISEVVRNLRNNSDFYKYINIDELNQIAYLHTANDSIYKTQFSNHENFKDVVSNLTDTAIIRFDNHKSESGLITKIISSLIVTWFLMLIIESFFSVYKDNEMIFDTKTDFYSVVKSDVKFTDVIGLEPVKQDLNEFIKYMKFPKIYKQCGCEVSKGLLFTGPPGCGKTFLAKAFASECNAKFIYTTGSSFDEIFVGLGAKRVRQLFTFARKNSPCVIFIDEIDAIGSRNFSMENNGRTNANNTINALLTELDGLISSENIMVIAATNLSQSLDPALTRSGRFDKTINFDLPTVSERVKLFELYLKKIKMDPEFNFERDIQYLANRTAMLTGADIKNICNQGVLNHMKKYRVETDTKTNKLALFKHKSNNGCTLEDLNEAYDDIIIGNKKSVHKALTDIERKQIAYHEAGHTLISCLVENGSVPLKVSIIPRGQSLGFTQPNPVDKYLTFKKELIANICITLGGRAAEYVIFDEVTSGASDDLQRVTEMTRKYVIDYCFGDKIKLTNIKIQSEDYKSKINEEMERIIMSNYNFTVNLLKNNRDLLIKISELLLERELLNKDDLLNIVPSEKIGSVKINF